MRRTVTTIAFSILAAQAAVAGGPTEVITAQTPAAAPAPVASNYVRIELGYGTTDLADGNWLPPGQSDPRVYFDLTSKSVGYGAFAIGHDWHNGVRADIGAAIFGSTNLTAPEGSPRPDDQDQHASITAGSVSSVALMANLFYSPLERSNPGSKLQPFVVFGAGIANNKTGTWTRENTEAETEVRSFEGSSNTDLAWSIGLGASYEVARAGKSPVMVEAAWRYYDLGTAKGGTTPLPGNGASQPQDPLNFTARHSVVSIGLRIPLGRN